MKLLKAAALSAIAATCLGAGSAIANEPPQPEVVAEWNSLPYKVESEDIRSSWENSDIFGQALIQGAKVDSDGNIYVSTARWGGKEIPSTLSKLVRNGDVWELEPYPSEEMNDVANAAGLKAVLGFEIDRNDVMAYSTMQAIARFAAGNFRAETTHIKSCKK